MAAPTRFTALAIGSTGDAINGVLSSLKSISFGAVPGNDSVVTTLAYSGVAAGAAVFVHPTSVWSGAYNDLRISAIATAADTIVVSAVNSAATSVTPVAQSFRVTALNF